MKKYIFIMLFICLIVRNTTSFASTTEESTQPPIGGCVKDVVDLDFEKMNIIRVFYTNDEGKEMYIQITDIKDISKFCDKFINLHFVDKNSNNMNMSIHFYQQYNLKMSYDSLNGFVEHALTEESELCKGIVSDKEIFELVQSFGYRWEEVNKGGAYPIFNEKIKLPEQFEANLPGHLKFTVNSPIYSMDNIQKTIDPDNEQVAPFIDGQTHRTFVPIRAISETLGYSVEWLSDEEKVILTKDNRIIEFSMNSENIRVKRGYKIETITSDVKPVIVNSRTFVPVRVMGEIMGYDVIWDDSIEQVTLEKNNSADKIEVEPYCIVKEQIEIGLRIINRNPDSVDLLPDKASFIDVSVYDSEGNEIDLFKTNLKAVSDMKITDTDKVCIVFDRQLLPDGKYKATIDLNCNVFIDDEEIILPQHTIEFENMDNNLYNKQIKEKILTTMLEHPERSKMPEAIVSFFDITQAETILKDALIGVDYLISKELGIIDAYVVSFDSVDTMENAVKILNGHDEIKYAEPNYNIEPNMPVGKQDAINHTDE